MFEEYLAACHDDGIKIILVYGPMYSGAYHKMSAWTRNRMYTTYQRWADKYDCMILDYQLDSICMDTLNFYNATHLNTKGANLFSMKLAHDLDSIGFVK